MRMVVDSNYLQSPALRTYLSASPTNYALLTEYTAIEAFKGVQQVIHRSMELLGEFPEQVIVLIGALEACGLSGERAQDPDGFVDRSQTQGFPEFCRHLAAARAGNAHFQGQLAERRVAAVTQMDRILADMPVLTNGFKLVEEGFSPEELKIIRRREAFTAAMKEKQVVLVLGMAAEMFRTHPSVGAVTRGPEVRDTFIFRSAVCTFVLALNEIRHGRAGIAAPGKLRNDVVDLNFATFATYYDGLLSADNKAQQIYGDAMTLLNNSFAV